MGSSTNARGREAEIQGLQGGFIPSNIPSGDLQTGWPPTTSEEDLTVFRNTVAVLESALIFTGQLIPADMSTTAPQPSGRPPKKEPEWADTSALLEGAAKLLDPTADIRSMTEAGEHARRVKASREQHLQRVQKDIRALSRALEESKLASQRPPTAPSESDHIRAMEMLDQARYTSAKTIMENDTQIQAREADIKRLKEEIAEWEKKDPMDEHELDSFALRGRILREMGFDVKSDATGNVEKVIIQCASGDTRVLPISADGDPYEQTKQLWEIYSS